MLRVILKVIITYHFVSNLILTKNTPLDLILAQQHKKTAMAAIKTNKWKAALLCTKRMEAYCLVKLDCSTYHHYDYDYCNYISDGVLPERTTLLNWIISMP